MTPTAKDLFDKMISENDECTSIELMIEFAKLHVLAVLKEASETKRDEIINCYPLEKIN